MFNSSNPRVHNSWCFKDGISNILPDIFERLNSLFVIEISGKLSSEFMKGEINKLFDLWNKWAVLDYQFLKGLKSTFFRDPNFTLEGIQQNYNNLMKDNSNDEENKFVLPRLIHLKSYYLKMYESNFDKFNKFCHENGVSSKGDKDTVVARVLAFEESNLKKDFLKFV